MFGDPQLKSKTLTDIEYRAPDGEGAYDLRYEEAQIVLPGDYKQVVLYNNNEYRRWYRVVVANIEADGYLIVDTSGEVLDPDQLIPLEPKEELPLLVYFQHAPEKPLRVEVFVDECFTDDPDGKFERQLHGRYLLSPAFDPKKFEIKAQPSRIAVRPWTRAVRFKLSLENKNALTVEGIVVRLVPRNRSRAYEDEIASIPIPDAIRPNQRLEIEIAVPVTERSAAVTPIDVRVEYRVPRYAASEKPRDFSSAAPRPLELVPIPYMRTYWPDWLIAGLIFLIINSILFGMPPVYKPELIVELAFEGYDDKNLPEGKIDTRNSFVMVYRVDPSAPINVSRRPSLRSQLSTKQLDDTAQSSGSKLVYHAVIIGNPGTGSIGNRLLWRPRGYLPFNDAGVKVELGLELKGEQEFVSNYDVSKVFVRDPETEYQIDQLIFSRKYLYGYNHRRVILVVPYASRIKVQLPKWNPSVQRVKVRARSEDTPSEGTPQEVQLEVECPNGEPQTVNIPTHSLLGDRESCKVRIIAESSDGTYRTEKVVNCTRGVTSSVVLPSPEPQGRFWLSVNTNPPGAEVFADGQSVGVTPFENVLVAVPDDGTVDILVRREEYRERRDRLSVSPNQRVQRTYTLRQENGNGSPPNQITLQVDSDPQGAEVLVNGAPQGRTPFTGEISAFRGTITIELRKREYRGVREIVRVSSERTIRRYYRLHRLPRIPIVIQINEPDAQVLVNGSPVENATGTLNVVQGARVSVRKDGYRAIPPSYTVTQSGTLSFWLLEHNQEFFSQLRRHLELPSQALQRINQSDLAVSVSFENNTIIVNANKDCWVQIYFYHPRSDPRSEARPELGGDWKLAYFDVPPRNQRFTVAEGPREVRNVDWGGNTHLYLIATTANMPPTRDLLQELKRGRVPQGKWCIVRIPRESISE